MLDFSLSNKLTDKVIVNNDLIFVLQQIDLLFNTDLGDVLGDPSFGTNYDRYLYTLGVSNFALETKILSDINKLDLRGFSPSVIVKIVDGTYRDIAFVDITLTGDYEDYTKTYVIK
jgi:hypothetical protein